MNKVVLLLMVLMCTFSSCTVHRGSFSMSVVEKGAIYKDEAVGVSHCYRVLGIGGLSRDALVYEAKKDLYRSYPLSNDESYLNFTLDFKESYYLLYSKSKVTMTADIIKFGNENDTIPFAPLFSRTIGQDRVKKSELFEIGDTVIFSKDKKATIVSFPKDGIVKLKLRTETGKFFTKNVSINKIYSEKKEFQGIKPGGTYAYEEQVNNEAKTFVGKVIAVGEKSLMLQKGNNKKIIIQEYKK